MTDDDKTSLKAWAELHVSHGLVQARQVLELLEELRISNLGESMGLRPYPTELPQEALALTWQAFSGQPVDRNHAFHAGYEVLGYAAGKVFPDNLPPVIGASVTDRLEDLPPVSVEEFEMAQAAFAHIEQQAAIPRVVGDAQGVSSFLLLVLRVALDVIRNRIQR